MLSKLNLSVGLVHIPVEIENALNDGTKPTGKFVCAESRKPIIKTAGISGTQSCGEKHESACSRTIGYPKADGSFFVPDESFLDSIRAEQDRQIVLDTFVPSDEVDPIYFNSTYVPKPGNGAERAFWLLGRRLQKLGRVAVGRAVLDKDEVVLFLRWSKTFDCLLLSVGVFDEQIKRALIAGVKSTEPEKAISRAEAQLADELITGVYVEPFNPTRYQPTRWHALRDEIVANGASPSGEFVVAAEEPSGPDLLTQLKASLAEKKKSATKKPAVKKTSRKKVA